MIEIINHLNGSTREKFSLIIVAAYKDANRLLDNLPENIRVNIRGDNASEVTGVGGFTQSRSQIDIAVVENFPDPSLQTINLRGVVFHELFHVQQNFTYDKSPFTAIDSAIYEGCALAFEKNYAGCPAIYSDYSQYSDEQLQK